MSHIHFIGGEKGGVGKSLVARVLAQYFIDRGLPFVGFDTDRSHGALLRFYGGYAAPAVIDREDSLDRIVEAAVGDPQRRVLVDLAAQTQPALVAWIEDSGVLSMAEELGVALTYWHVMDAGRDSVDLLAELLDQFGARLGREDRQVAPASRRHDAEDRRPKHELLGSREPQRARRDGAGPAGTPARQGVAAAGIRRDRPRRRLTPGPRSRTRAVPGSPVSDLFPSDRSSGSAPRS